MFTVRLRKLKFTSEFFPVLKVSKLTLRQFHPTFKLNNSFAAANC